MKPKILETLLQKNFLIIFLLGMSGGLPLAMTSSTLGYWLEEAHIDIKTIGAIALIGVFYNIKFLWSPLVDVVSIPYFTKKLGRRRSWMIASQLCLMASIIGMSFFNPATSLGMTVLFALAVAFFSATQDIVIDAFRIESFETDSQASAVAFYTYGYRIGMLISGAVALKLSEFISWNGVYIFLAATIMCGILAALICDEPKFKRKTHVSTFSHQLRHAIIDPFADFMKQKGWLLFLAFIVAYKFPAAFLGGGLMSSFYLKMGFSKDEILVAVKIFGLASTMIGLLLGGIIAGKLGLVRALWVDAILQAATNLLFIPLIYSNNPYLLTLAVSAENMASAMGTVVLVAFISRLCNREFSATQYALLSSFAALGRTFLAANGGWIVDSIGWAEFFVITFFAGIPALLMIPFVKKYLGKTVDNPAKTA
jgi:PAT family beta-lactamase induction signal transducer AmpG